MAPIAALRRSHATAQHAAQQQQHAHQEALSAEQQRTAELGAELGSTVQERVQAATAPLRHDLASLELRHESLSHELERQRQLSERLTEDASLLREEKRASQSVAVFGVCVLCVQHVSRQNLRVLKHMHMKSAITFRSPMPGGLGPLELIAPYSIDTQSWCEGRTALYVINMYTYERTNV